MQIFGLGSLWTRNALFEQKLNGLEIIFKLQLMKRYCEKDKCNIFQMIGDQVKVINYS